MNIDTDRKNDYYKSIKNRYDNFIIDRNLAIVSIALLCITCCVGISVVIAPPFQPLHIAFYSLLSLTSILALITYTRIELDKRG